MPTLTDKELEERLTAAGKSLAQPPSSLDELLPLLDRVEELLSKVEQSPPKTMQNALTPLMKALVMEVLLEHSDIDVKVGVASCISEITRITAPDAPYDDDKMKDVFQLIVSSFENLSDVSSRSHEKRVTILETVAKVSSCVTMLDLECDQMIVDMFQHFLKAIRANHSEMIFTSMETIMTLVIEESEDISPDLLAPILATLRRNNQDVTPIARKLAERVIQNAADKLRPCLRQAVTSLETSFDEYSEVVASVCRENTDTVGHSNESILKTQPVVEGNCTSASPARDPGTPVVEGNCTSASPARDLGTPAAQDDGEGTNFPDKDSTAIRSPKSVVSNGINETGTNEITNEADTSKKVDSEGQLEANATFKAESDDCDARKPEKLEAEDEQVQQEEENHDIPAKDVHTSPTEVKPVEAAESLDKGEDRSVEAVTEASKPVESVTEASKPVEAVTEASKPVEAVNEASPAQSGSHPDERLSEKEIEETREEKLVGEDFGAPQSASEEESISEVKKQRRSGKKRTDDSSDKDKALTEEVASKNDDGYASDSEARSLDRAEKPKDASNKKECGSTLRKEYVKKSGRGKPKPTFEKDTPKSSAREDHGKDTVTPRKSQLKSTKHEGVQEETPKTSAKRKHTPGKEKSDRQSTNQAKKTYLSRVAERTRSKTDAYLRVSAQAQGIPSSSYNDSIREMKPATSVGVPTKKSGNNNVDMEIERIDASEKPSASVETISAEDFNRRRFRVQEDRSFRDVTSKGTGEGVLNKGKAPLSRQGYSVISSKKKTADIVKISSEVNQDEDMDDEEIEIIDESEFWKHTKHRRGDDVRASPQDSEESSYGEDSEESSYGEDSEESSYGGEQEIGSSTGEEQDEAATSAKNATIGRIWFHHRLNKDDRIRLRLPSAFVKASGFTRKMKVLLEYPGGTDVVVQLTNSGGQIALGTGWMRFYKANNLVYDKAYHFELVSAEVISVQLDPYNS